MSKEKTGNSPGNKSSRDAIRPVLFLLVTLTLSIILIILSTDLFIILHVLVGPLSTEAVAIFIFIISVNVAIAAFSIRALFTAIEKIFSAEGQGMIRYIVETTTNETKTAGPEGAGNKELFFSSLEVEVIEALRRKGNHILQNRLTLDLGISKATVSRVLSSLERKGAIIRVRKGVTNEVILSSPR
ncbi:hypothetical protein ApAK_06670 [Thermoplasmatales archaeon AK]|nr:hypothetical protein [Thermoplasmatales archaeon AK]